MALFVSFSWTRNEETGFGSVVIPNVSAPESNADIAALAGRIRAHASGFTAENRAAITPLFFHQLIDD